MSSSTAYKKVIYDVDCKFGAPLGRADKGQKPKDKKIFDRQVPLKLFKGKPLGHARQYVSQDLYLHIPYWGITLDPAEDNIPRCDGIIEHDNYIILTKWLNEPITFRFSIRDTIRSD